MPMDTVTAMDYNVKIRSIAVATVSGNIIIFKVVAKDSDESNLD